MKYGIYYAYWEKEWGIPLEIDVIAESVAHTNWATGGLVISEVDHIASAPVDDLAYLPKIRHIIAHEIIDCVFIP